MHSFNLMFVRTRIAIRLRNPSVWPLFSYRVCWYQVLPTYHSMHIGKLGVEFVFGWISQYESESKRNVRDPKCSFIQILFMEDLPKQVEDSFKLKSVPNNDTKLRHSHRWSSEKGDLHDSEPFFAIL